MDDKQTHLADGAKRKRRRRVLGTVCGLAGVLVLALLVRHFRGTSAADAQSPAPVAGVRRAVVSQGGASNASASPGVSTRAADTASPTGTRSNAVVRASSTQSGARPAVPGTTGASKPQVVAVVNGEPISRTELGREAVRQYGREVLEAMVNKRLIAQECQRRGVAVTQAEVDAEIKRLAQRFNLPLDQWLKLLEDERGITPEEYAEDIVWSTLALRKLAGEKLKVSQSELAQEFERRYGPAVDVRLIACGTLEKAKQVLAKAKANPEHFGKLAKQYSEDTSASLEGRIQPIRKHCGFEQIEQAAFSLQPGEVSDIIEAGGQYLILRCERKLPGSQTVRFQEVAPQLEEVIRERKLREAAGEIFQALQDAAQVVNAAADARRGGLDQRAADQRGRSGRKVHPAPRQGSAPGHDRPQADRPGAQEGGHLREH